MWTKYRGYAAGLLLLLLTLVLTACGQLGDVALDVLQEYVETQQEPVTAAEDIRGELVLLPDETAAPADKAPEPDADGAAPADVPKDANLPVYGDSYYDLKKVVLYLYIYDELPPNYITKNQARALGWEGGSVEKYKEGAAIGGDRFGNYEGLLPTAGGRSYTECDIDTLGYSSRGSRRLIFSNDGLYFYTSDHYETFAEVTVTEDYEVIW